MQDANWCLFLLHFSSNLLFYLFHAHWLQLHSIPWSSLLVITFSWFFLCTFHHQNPTTQIIIFLPNKWIKPKKTLLNNACNASKWVRTHMNFLHRWCGSHAMNCKCTTYVCKESISSLSNLFKLVAFISPVSLNILDLFCNFWLASLFFKKLELAIVQMDILTWTYFNGMCAI